MSLCVREVSPGKESLWWEDLWKG